MTSLADRSRVLARQIPQVVRNLRNFSHGFRYGRAMAPPTPPRPTPAPPCEPSRLEAYFDAHQDGPGIWKWRHYFDVYDRHFSRFVGHEVHVVEIGIYSGGSLGMWRDYFGDGCRVHGVDIEPACRAYEGEHVEVFIGNQADPAFWARFREQVPVVDVVIDDGGHQAHQQIATLEALLPHISPGGVYLCEDVHHPPNEFLAYMDGFARALHRGGEESSGFQQHVASIHQYPFVIVIEKPVHPVERFDDPQRGSKWEPPAFWERAEQAAGRR
jgi:Methyltransferase domain